MDTSKFKVVKVRLKRILKKDVDYTQLFEAIDKSKQIIHTGYLFLRSFILYKVIERTPIKVNINLVRSAINTAYKCNTKGRPSSNPDLINELKEHWKLFSQKTGAKKINAVNVSYILNNYSESIYSAIVVNLQMHLNKHLWKYILVIAEEFNGSPLDTEQKKILKQVKKDILTQPPSVRMPQNQINLYTTNPETGSIQIR